MHCPNCGTENEGANKFCITCGTSLAGDKFGKQYAAPPHSVNAQRAQIGSSVIEMMNIWGPFAGLGPRYAHNGYLAKGQSEKAPQLIEKIAEGFKEREIPNTSIREETLVAKGLLVESRPYFILKRRLTTLALYVAEFGKDLFISHASYLKSPISNFRGIFIGAMLGFELLFFLSVPGAFGSLLIDSGYGSSIGSALAGFSFVMCCIGPLGTINTGLLALLLVYSIYSWITDRDFFAALRVPPNEFDEDDLMAMEKAVVETVKESLTSLGLNWDDLEKASIGRDRRLF